jgi:hypothetical protein
MEEKWIYRSVAFSFANLSKMDEKLSEYGQKGWEEKKQDRRYSTSNYVKPCHRHQGAKITVTTTS